MKCKRKTYGFYLGARPLEKILMFFQLALAFSLCLSLFNVRSRGSETLTEFNGRSEPSLEAAILQGKRRASKAGLSIKSLMPRLGSIPGSIGPYPLQAKCGNPEFSTFSPFRGTPLPGSTDSQCICGAKRRKGGVKARVRIIDNPCIGFYAA